MKKCIVVIFLSLFLFAETKADHALGGEITWNQVGKDSFLVDVIFYRDCNGTSSGSLMLNVKCSTTGSNIGSWTISKPGGVDITPVCKSSCTRCVSSFCSFPYGIQKYIYSQLIILTNAGSCCDILLNVQTCCRPLTITTGIANQSFYIGGKLNRCLNSKNNSPQFNNNPVIITCVGQDIAFNYGAFNSDSTNISDSFSYEWTSPLSYNATPISFYSSYTYEKPIFFWGFPNTNLPFPRGLHLNKSTGEISFRPMKVEETVMCVKVKKWRKDTSGVFKNIAEVTRDCEVIVISCPNNKAPILFGPYYKSVTVGDTVKFTISTIDSDNKDSLTISWDKSIKNAVWTDNNGFIKHPTGELVWVPQAIDESPIPHIFYVTVKDDACPISSTITSAFKIQVCNKIEPDSIQNFNLGCGNYLFTTKIKQKASYNWISPASSSNDSIFYHFTYPGKYPVQLSLSNACSSKTLVDTITINDSFLTVKLPNDRFLCSKQDIQVNAIILNAKGKVKLLWSTGDTINTSNLLKNIDRDTFVICTIKDTLACSHSDTMMIFYNNIKLSIGADQIKCSGSSITIQTNFTHGKGKTVNYNWYKIPSTSSFSTSSAITVTNPGTYVCVATDNLGCSVSDTMILQDYPLSPPANAGNDTTLCANSGWLKLTGTPVNPNGYWLGIGIVKSNNDYYFNPSGLGNNQKYNVTYSYQDNYKCTYHDTKIITVYDTVQVFIDPVNPLCLFANKVTLYGIPTKGIWSGKGVENNTFFNPRKAGSGIHQIIYTYNNYGCVNADTTYIKVYPFDTTSFWIKTPYTFTTFCPGYKLIPLFTSPANGKLSGPVIYPGQYFNADTSFGTYNFSYKIVDTIGCEYNYPLKLIVDKPSITIDRNDKVICEYEQVNTFAKLYLTKGYQWLKSFSSDGWFVGPTNNNSVSYQPGPNDIFKGGFWLKVESNDSICNAEDSVYYNFNKITPQFSSDVTKGKVPLIVKFYNNSISVFGNVQYSYWDFGDGHSITIQNPLHSYNDTGVYSVRLIVKTLQNCFDTILMPDYISVYDGSSIPETETHSMMIFPNPASNSLNITSTDESAIISSVSLFNAIGEEVYKEDNIYNQHFTVKNPKLLNQYSGICLLRIVLSNGVIINKTIFFD